MQIQISGGTRTVPDGTLAVYIDPSGKVLWVGLVTGDVLQDAMTQRLGNIDPTKDSHTEIELAVSSLQPAGETLQFQAVDSLRVCRNQSGNIVKCPPR